MWHTPKTCPGLAKQSSTDHCWCSSAHWCWWFVSGTWYSSCQKIFVQAISIFMCTYVNGMLPELFLDMFTPISDIHSYDAWQAKNNNLFVSFKSTSRGQQSITYIGPHVWNFILSKINPRCSIGSFKRYIWQSLQHCSVSDLTWWLLTLKQQNVLLTLTSVCLDTCI